MAQHKKLDAFQRKHPVLGVPIAVIFKFVDDQGNYLSAIITFYAFIAIFPLLLLAGEIAGFLLQGNPELEQSALNSALRQFPIIGEELGRPESLRGSQLGVVIGSLAALYGSMGLGQALQNAMNVTWAVPRNSRPNPFLLRFRSLLILFAAGAAVLALSVASAIGASSDVISDGLGPVARWSIRLLTVAAVAAVLTVLFRLAAARQHGIGAAVPGAVVVALLWQGLQVIGALYVTRVLTETSAMNPTFGLVLGLVGLIYLASLMAVFGMEVNVVLARRLWPRALLTVFTDSVSLTDADRRAYTSYARAQRHKAFETVRVTFEDQAATMPIDVGAQPRTGTPSASRPLPPPEGNHRPPAAAGGGVEPRGAPAPTRPAPTRPAPTRPAPTRPAPLPPDGAGPP